MIEYAQSLRSLLVSRIILADSERLSRQARTAKSVEEHNRAVASLRALERLARRRNAERRGAMMPEQRLAPAVGMPAAYYMPSHPNPSDAPELPTLRGHAAIWYDSSDHIGTSFQLDYDVYEIVKRGAFADALKRGDDVVFNLNHDVNYVIARTKAGNMKLWEDSIGLAFEVQPTPTYTACDIASNIQARNISQCSFAFDPEDVVWDDDGECAIRILARVGLMDCCACARPAYRSTDIVAVSQRSLAERDADSRARLYRLIGHTSTPSPPRPRKAAPAKVAPILG